MTAELLTLSAEHERIACMDPLELDMQLSQLPDRNNAADIGWLDKTTTRSVEVTQCIDNPDPLTASACLRDLDFLASSLLRHGVDPMHAISGLEDEMIRLGAAAGTVPRSTITTYAGANPSGFRQRTFTGSREEDLFITGLRDSYAELEIANQELSQVDLSDTDTTDLLTALQSTSAGMDTMISSIVDVRRNIPPEYFTGVMRPYFEPLVIGGKQYSAAGGGQLQLVALEAMLWGTTANDQEWRGFYEENYPYLSPAQRNALGFFFASNNGETVLSRAARNAQLGNTDSRVAEALTDVFRKIRKFRYPHRKVAEDNFNLRPSEAVGSGSYTPAILASLIVSTETNMATVGEM